MNDLIIKSFELQLQQAKRTHPKTCAPDIETSRTNFMANSRKGINVTLLRSRASSFLQFCPATLYSIKGPLIDTDRASANRLLVAL